MKPETKLHCNHEVTHWRAKPFVIGVVSFLIFMGLTYVIVGGLTTSWTHRVWPPSGPVANHSADAAWNNSAPQLEVDGPASLKQLRAVENQRLNSLRWTDDNHQFAAIPIDEAMTLLAQADADHRLDQLLPKPKPATPIDLQQQKSTEATPASKRP